MIFIPLIVCISCLRKIYDYTAIRSDVSSTAIRGHLPDFIEHSTVSSNYSKNLKI